ncbi:uncharacterized protein LOC135130274 isoform X2 [Zophobas morio]|uniref:uncharacterized protein LOC135130274 isoform X2 n=1 Tax=Zophobas morio TaxID=2755281 RepID=UPI003082AC81
MRTVIIQILLLFFASGEIAKRSPLQVGLVTFTEKPHLLHNVSHKTGISPVIMGAHSHKWIPGHALLLARTVETVFVHPAVYSPYRHHLGGFGIGLDVGGQGAGHGFHVVLDF